MKFKAEFYVDNAAFRGPVSDGWDDTVQVDLVADQLRRIADTIENGICEIQIRKIVDTNGNTVGQWQFVDAEKEDIGQVLRDQSP